MVNKTSSSPFPIPYPKIFLTLKLDVKFEEFYDFFCTDVSNKTKNNLYDAYEKIRGDKE